MGAPMISYRHKATPTTPREEASMAADHPSKTRWEKQNMIEARAKINRNQDPDLYNYLKQQPALGQATRELLRLGLTTLQQQQNTTK